MRLGTMVVSVSAFMLLQAPVMADIIVLRNGSSVRGTLANRDQIAAQPGGFEMVSILTDSTDGQAPVLQRIDTQSIQYIVLEDGEGRRQVIDFALLHQTAAPKPPTATSAPTEYSVVGSSHGDATACIVVGVILGTVGALVKFGGEKATITGSGIDYSEKSYNGLNYAMIIGGAGLTIAGMVLLATPDPTFSIEPGFDGAMFCSYRMCF